MPIETVSRLCTPNAVVTSDSLVEQVAQIEDFASGKVDGREFFQRNHFTAGLQLLVERGFERLAGRSDDGAFYLTQAMGGGKTHSLIAFGLLAADPTLRREIVPKLRSRQRVRRGKSCHFQRPPKSRDTFCGALSPKNSGAAMSWPRSGVTAPRRLASTNGWPCSAMSPF